MKTLLLNIRDIICYVAIMASLFVIVHTALDELRDTYRHNLYIGSAP